MIIKTAEETPATPVEIEGAKDVSIRLLIHKDEGAPNFYMRQFDVAPGGCTPHHEHDWEHEVYVLAGRGAVVRKGVEEPVRAGQCIFVPAGEKHQFRNTGDQTFRFLCLVPAENG